MKNQIIIFLLIAVLSSCNKPKQEGFTQQPVVEDYYVGEKWV